MKNIMIIIFSILIIFASLHCASTARREFADYGQARNINGTDLVVFQTTLEYFRDLGYAIEKEDWKSGKIETAYKERTRIGNRERRSKIIATVKAITDKQAKLTLEYLIEERQLPGSWELLEFSTTDEMFVYERHFEQITARVEGRPIK